jgi:hypothetical protein
VAFRTSTVIDDGFGRGFVVEAAEPVGEAPGVGQPEFVGVEVAVVSLRFINRQPR